MYIKLTKTVINVDSLMLHLKMLGPLYLDF